MTKKKEKARVTEKKRGFLQVYYQSTYWNAECEDDGCLSVNDMVEVVGGIQLPLKVIPLVAWEKL